MAYNPAIYNPYAGGYGQVQQPMQPVQSYAAPAQAKGVIEWVDGEVGARAVQLPIGMTTPIALWDTNEPVIYVRSMNQMGMPNPIKRIRYVVEEDTPRQSGDMAKLTGGESRHDMSEYVRKDEFAAMKDELLRSIKEIGTGSAKHARSDDE